MFKKMDSEFSLEASFRKFNMWHIETTTVSSYKYLPVKDANGKFPLKHLSGKSSDGSSNRTLQIVDLPPELLELIFRKLTFDNVGKIRSVCQYFNTIASSLLNSEFSRLRMNMLHRFQSIKAQMPRRESARRKHPLARESDIIETLHMRLTLLHMTFGKHIERKHCCFFAGEILDEVYRILHYVKTTPNLNRAYKVTDELFDLSTMAMEYFKEHIEPSLPEITYFATDFLEYTPTITSSPKTQVSLLEDSVLCTPSSSSRSPALESPSASCHPPVNQLVNKKLRKLRETVKKNNGDITAVKQELKVSKRKIALQQRQIVELKSRCEDYDRKFQNTSRKLSAILQELNRFKTEFQYWRSKSPATPCACGTITPVLEFVDLDVPVADVHAEKLSPRSQDDLADDFKPINPDLESMPSCSSYQNGLPNSHMAVSDRRIPCTPTCSASNKYKRLKILPLPEGESKDAKTDLQKDHYNLRKRKFNIDISFTKNKKRVQSPGGKDMCTSLGSVLTESLFFSKQGIKSSQFPAIHDSDSESSVLSDDDNQDVEK